MNPWLLLIALAVWTASVGGSYFYGEGVGADAERARQASVEAAVRDTRDAAQKGAAEAIAKLRPIYTTIKQETEREIRTNTVYAGCKLPPVGLRLANDALAGRRTEPAGDSKLPSGPGADARGK